MSELDVSVYTEEVNNPIQHGVDDDDDASAHVQHRVITTSQDNDDGLDGYVKDVELTPLDFTEDDGSDNNNNNNNNNNSHSHIDDELASTEVSPYDGATARAPQIIPDDDDDDDDVETIAL